jgi:hypothetical protein
LWKSEDTYSYSIDGAKNNSLNIINSIGVGLVSIGNIELNQRRNWKKLIIGIELIVGSNRSFCDALLEAVDEASTK